MIELSVSDLHLDYKANAVLKGVSLALKQREVVSLLGPSGCGKTTLLRTIAGLETPKRGRIAIGQLMVFDSTQKREVPPEARNLGLVFQSYALWPHKTVFENVAYPLQLRRTSTPETRQRVEKILEQLGLSHLMRRYPHQLSGGQQQRVAIGRALVYNPPVLLLDEPLSNLDAKLREEARAFLRELIVRLGLSALIVTHDQGEALAISDKILLLNNGRIEQQGTPQHMYDSPNTLFCAEFMGSNNRLTGKVTEVRHNQACIEGPNGTLWGKVSPKLEAGQEGVAIIRVEQVRFAQEAEDNTLDMQLVTSMYLGNRWEYVFRTLGDNSLNALALRAYGHENRLPGKYRLCLPPSQLWIFAAPA
jgi:iron(III) transport system ATP-binding protein